MEIFHFDYIYGSLRLYMYLYDNCPVSKNACLPRRDLYTSIGVCMCDKSNFWKEDQEPSMREDSFSDKESKEISILAQIRHKKGGCHGRHCTPYRETF